MKFYVGKCSDIGNFRPNNEDAVFSAVIPVDAGELCLGIVCDGIGGLKDGEFASFTMIGVISEWFMEIDRSLSFDDITKQFLDKVYKTSVYISEQSKILAVETGTTMTAFLSIGDKYMIANVGDSRTYQLDKSINQITSDDVTISSSGRSALNQCIGHDCRLYINTFYGQTAPGNRYLLCTDGFYKKMNAKRLLSKSRAINRFTDISKLLQKEIEAIKKLGEKDNISAVLIKCVKGE